MNSMVMTTPWMAAILFLLLGVLSGYAAGRRFGKRAGMAEGMAYAPLELYKKALEIGRCTICGTKSQGSPQTDAAGEYFTESKTEIVETGYTEVASAVTHEPAYRNMGVKQMALRFTKMHGLGNNYIYIELVTQQADISWPLLAQKVSNINFGLGSDGLILILPGTNGADFRMRMFNLDGSEAQMCGNGIRCVGKFVYDHALTTKQSVLVDTLAGRLELDLKVVNGKVEAIRVDMGEPRLRRGDIPMLGGDASSECREHPIEIDGVSYSFTAVSMGNPHVITFVDSVSDFPVAKVGPQVENHPLFPQRANIEFARMISPTHIEMRVWERGSGETYACGTGACATAVAAAWLGKAERHAKVQLLGGILDIEWAENNHVYMTGPAVEVATGEFSASWLAEALQQ